MILLVIKHGEPEADILNVHEGRADFELTPGGTGAKADKTKRCGNTQRLAIEN